MKRPERHLKAAVTEMAFLDKTTAKLKSRAWIRISKYCVNIGCKKVGQFAERISNGMWIVRCADCVHKKITLDMGKIVDERPYAD